ncbi:MAG TPA: hypothetical protein VGR62_10085 [Candidatus Binatia bacterium]|jgi:hypothetical protein|nr:hypothetical protein [Candidatus Binatia bacterium]
MRPSTASLAGVVLLCTATLALAGEPVLANFRFYGFVPVDRDASRVQIAIAKQATTLAVALTACRRNGVRGVLKADAVDVEACMATAYGRFTEHTADLDAVACITPALQNELGTFFKDYAVSFDPILWCDGSEPLPDGFSGGFVPTANVYRTESAVSRKLMDYGRDISSCVQRAMARLVAGRAPELEACLATARADADASMLRGQLSRRIAGLEPDDCLKGANDVAAALDAIANLAPNLSEAVFCETPESPPPN